MSPTITFENLEIPLQAVSFEPAPGGFVLHGPRVSLLHPFHNAHFYRHGFHSWSLAAWLPLNTTIPAPSLLPLWPQIDHPDLLGDYPFSGSGVTALRGPDQNVLLLGALGLDARLQAGPDLLSGEYASGSGDWFLAWGDEAGVFTRYAELLAGRLGSAGQSSPPRVWCSWYSLFRDIDEPEMHAVLEDLHQREPRLPFDVLQIDDGWQMNLGDWEANRKFQGGMQEMAARIRAAGMQAGLWLAPLIAGPGSSLYKDHPDWLLHDRDGALVPAGHNWGAPFYGLDATHPEVQDWLAALIRQVRAWGYEYLKLDFLYAAALPGVRYQSLPGEAAYRQGLSVMREAAGDAYVLACGAPVFASLGLADGIRAGPDVAPYWDNADRSLWLHDPTGPGTLNAIRTTLHRLWMRPLVQVDPDVVFFRTRFNLMSQPEKLLLQRLAQITGFRATSDLPAWLDPDERRALAQFLAAQPAVERLGQYCYRVGGEEVDYTPFAGGLERIPDAIP